MKLNFFVRFFFFFVLAGSIVRSVNPGLEWERDGSNPVIKTGDAGMFDSQGVEGPYCLQTETGMRMYYTAVDGLGVKRIALAESTDGIHWIKLGVVLDRSDGFRFDTSGVEAAYILREPPGFIMWYVGTDGSHTRIGMAESVDGVAWQRIDGTGTGGSVIEPSLDKTRYDSEELRGVAVTKTGDSYAMHYGGRRGVSEWRIGLAISPDGRNWIKYNGNEEGQAVFDMTEEGFDDGGVWSPFIVYDADSRLYRMWYSCVHHCVTRSIGGIGYATSVDGLAWVRHGSAIERTVALTFDSFDVSEPSIIESNDGYIMYYSGSNDVRSEIGRAVAESYRIIPDRADIQIGDSIVHHPVQVDFELFNSGVRHATLVGVELPHADLSITGLPALPIEMAPGDSYTVSLDYLPSLDSEVNGEIAFELLESSQRSYMSVTGQANELALNMDDRLLQTGEDHGLYISYVNLGKSAQKYSFFLALEFNDSFYFFPNWEQDASSVDITFAGNFYLPLTELARFKILPEIPDGMYQWWAVMIPYDGGGSLISNVSFTTSIAYQSLQNSTALRWFEDNRDVIWLDVRSSAEHCEGHIPGSVNIPLDELDNEVGNLDRDRQIVVYSNYGVRGRAACEVLLKHGFRNLWSLDLGISMWNGPEAQCF